MSANEDLKWRTDGVGLNASGVSVAQRDEDAASDFNWNQVRKFVSSLPNYYRLLGIILALGIIYLFFFYATTVRTYTAMAIIGPPGPSPTDTMMGSVRSSSISSLIGGNSANARNPYQDFMQLLLSSRLSRALVAREGFLQEVYADRWDAEKKQWRQPGGIAAAVRWVKSTLGIGKIRSAEPGVDEVTVLLNTNLDIGTSKTVGSDSNLLGRTGVSYYKITFTDISPQRAEKMLGLVLDETDQIVRRGLQRDVSARIDFLRTELRRQDITTDERATLTSILSTQEQLQTIIQADQRYASNLVVPPYASSVPTSPTGPINMLVKVIVISVLLWAALVYCGQRFERFGRLTEWLQGRGSEGTK